MINSANGHLDYLVFDEADEAFSSEYVNTSFDVHDSVSSMTRTMCFMPFRSPNKQWSNITRRFENAIVLETNPSNRVPSHIKQTFRHVR